METVSYGYARRREHSKTSNPFKYRWIQKGDKYVPDRKMDFVFGTYINWDDERKPALLVAIPLIGDHRPIVCTGITGEDYSEGWFVNVNSNFIECERKHRHMFLRKGMEEFLLEHRDSYGDTHRVITLEEVEELFL